MTLQNSTTTPAQADVPRKKLRAIVFGGGIGMFPPLHQRMKEDFDVIATLQPKESQWLGVWYRLVSVRWPRNAWYRKWRYFMEKTGPSFLARTRSAAAQLEPYRGQYDVILFFGAMYAPSLDIDKPMFLFTDSCRWLSSRNVHDSISHFANKRDEAEWLALEGDLYRQARRVFVGSGSTLSPAASHASAHAIPGPPAFVTTPTRLPRGSGWPASSAATSNSSPTVPVRITPA